MKRVYAVALIALGLLTVLSLALNVIVIYGITRIRETTHGIVVDARDLVDSLAEAKFTYTVEVDQTFPISTQFPFSQTVAVPINTVVPINTRVVVPVDLGVTTYNLRVPINTVFPIDMDFTVPVSQVVDVEMEVPVNVEVPVEVVIPETPLAGYLAELDAALARTEQRLERPLWQP